MTPSGDGAFAALRIASHGMAGIRTAKVINFACRCMDADEFYVEVGTFSGFTLISAGYQSNAMCFGIDDFSLEEVVKPESREEGKKLVRAALNKHLGEYGSVNCRFIESDFRSIGLEEKTKGKLSVLFIDGKHTYTEVKDTLEKFTPYLSKDAVIIFDDVQFGNIPKYIREMLLTDEYEMLAYLVATVNQHDTKVHLNMALDEYIANGICVMRRINAANS